MLSSTDGRMPMPVSSTTIRNQSTESIAKTETDTVIEPSKVYLMAFEKVHRKLVEFGSV